MLNINVSSMNLMLICASAESGHQRQWTDCMLSLSINGIKCFIRHQLFSCTTILHPGPLLHHVWIY